MLLSRISSLTFLLIFSAGIGAQNDSASAVKKKEPFRFFSWSDPHSPTKASLYSAILPGLGQAYNRKWVKVPVVYATFGTAAWFMLDQRQKMRDLNKQFKAAYALNPDTSIDVNLIARRDNHRRMRDFGILALTGIYALQIIDATVDAHFYKLNIDQDLTARFRPSPSRFLTLSYQF